ncbi:Major facilitator superfamily domain-containing protein 4B [Halotydeus destructor]|nr:Major facilitator superfamily domain-containing protein 4B [Halotydeus destructor]
MEIPVKYVAVNISSHVTKDALRRKHVLTAVICLGFLVYGIAYSLLGPTLIDLSSLLNSSIEELSYGFSIRQLCFLVGSLFFGWLYSFVNRQLGMALTLVSLSVCMYAIPRLTSLNQFLVSQGFLGFAASSVEVTTSAWLLELWRQDSNPYLQCMHFFYAFGAAISPLISEPYLSPEVDPLHPDMKPESSIIVPYTLSALSIFIASVIQIVMYIQSPYKQGGEEDDGRDLIEKESLLSSQANLHVPKNYLNLLVIIGGLLLSFDVVIELNSSNYLQAFVVSIGMTKSKGALMLGALSSSFTVGRLAGIYIATRLKPATMLTLDLGLVLIGNLIILTNHSETGLWLGLIVLGFGYATCYPTVCAYIGERIQITDMISGVFLFVSSIGFTIEPLIAGKLIVTHPLVYVYVNLFCTAAMSLLFLYLNCSKYLKYHGSRIKRT